jgi:hypothetical protein
MDVRYVHGTAVYYQQDLFRVRLMGVSCWAVTVYGDGSQPYESDLSGMCIMISVWLTSI